MGLQVCLFFHAGSVRKFLAPEIELHGTKASLSADRYTGKIKLIRQNQELETLHELPPAFEFGNRFRAVCVPCTISHDKGNPLVCATSHVRGWMVGSALHRRSLPVRERWTLEAGMIPASNVCLNKF